MWQRVAYAVRCSTAFTPCRFLCSQQQQQPVKLSIEGHVARLTLNRPASMNAIEASMPSLLESLVAEANDNPSVKVLVLQGAGGNFCSGYDLKLYAEAPRGSQPGSQLMPWDPYEDYQFMWRATQHYMSLWRSLKPVLARIEGSCIGGGSDMALLCDVTIATDDAKIGYPPARLWGCPTTAMWAHRLGLEQAKRLLLTGDVISGRRAAQIGLIGESVPTEQIDEAERRFTDRLAGVPVNQLFFQKLMLNSVVEAAGLANTQRLATLLDGMSRHTPEGVQFQRRCEEVGFKQAVQERDRN